MSLACAVVTHAACVTNMVLLPGITNAHASRRSSHLPTNPLHTRQRARPVGATLSLYTVGRATKPADDFLFTMSLPPIVHSRPDMKLEAAPTAPQHS